MAYEGPQVPIPGLVAGADLSGAQFKFVKLSADKTVVLCAALTDQPIGVLQNKPLSGEAANVCGLGVTKLSGDADIDAGNLLKTSADGQAAVATPGTDLTHFIVGQAIVGNTGAGGLITAFINCANIARAA